MAASRNGDYCRRLMLTFLNRLASGITPAFLSPAMPLAIGL
jgi:hypothetical protein